MKMFKKDQETLHNMINDIINDKGMTTCINVAKEWKSHGQYNNYFTNMVWNFFYCIEPNRRREFIKNVYGYLHDEHIDTVLKRNKNLKHIYNEVTKERG